MPYEINTRLCLKRASYEDWTTNNPILLPGEVGVVYDLPQKEKDAIGIVIGAETKTTFQELPIYYLPLYKKPQPKQNLASTLSQVGVSLKDVAGQFKNISTIIEELSSKWKDLDKISQFSLAQNLTDIQHSNQFIETMDNYINAKSDFQSNLNDLIDF